MELIYLYIKNFGHKIEDDNDANAQFIMNKEINFSDRFNFKYDIKTQKLHIEKTEEKVINFYGKSIKNLKMIVGQNGSGKSTILDILGMNRSDRIDESFVRKYKTSKNKPKFGHNSNDDISYFKDEYVMVYLIKDDKDLDKCLFGMEVVGDFFEDKESGEWKGFIKNLKEHKDTFYKIPIGFVFQYEENEIRATPYHFFNHIDPNTKELLYSLKPGDRVINRICDDCNYVYLAEYYSDRIKIEKSKISKDRDREDDEYLMRRFYRKLTMAPYLDYKGGYDLLKDEKYKKFREKLFTFSPEIIFSHDFSKTEIIEPFSYHGEKEKIQNNYDKLINILKKDLYNEKCDILKEKSILKWIIDYILASFTNLLKQRFDKNHIESILNKDETEFNKKIEKDLQIINLNIEEFINFDEQLLLKNMPFSMENKEIDFYKEFIFMILVVKKITASDLEIDIKDDILKIFPKEEFDEINSDFQRKVYFKLLISRYVLSRLSLEFDVIKEGVYQESFEQIIKKMMKLEPECFSKNNTICLTCKEQTKENVYKLLETLVAYEKEEYCDVSIHFKLRVQHLSEGERKIFILFSKLIVSLEEGKGNNLNIILLDEPDASLHPQWAKELMDKLFLAIDTYSQEIKKINVQLIISTHSPFLLSDIDKKDIILLDYDNDTLPDKRAFQFSNENYDTFAANIHTMFKNSFFLKNTIGDFANKKIKNTLMIMDKYSKYIDKKITKEAFSETANIYMNYEHDHEINEKQLETDLKNKIEYVISIIGEPLIKKKLEEKYRTIFYNDKEYEIQIMKLKQEKAKLEKLIKDNEIEDIDSVLELLNIKINELKKKAECNSDFNKMQ